MTETAKRRPGRPKGSRNRPKPRAIPAPGSVKASVFPPAEGERIVSPMPVEARVIEGVGTGGNAEAHLWPEPVLEPSGALPIHITLSTKVAMSQPGQQAEIDWPIGMPLPATGDRVVVGEIGGYVGGIEFHPADHRVVLILR